MKIGEEKHEKILEITIGELQNQGYKVINLEGKSPSMIGIKDNKSYAYVLCLKGKRTLTEIEDTYHMFDVVERIEHDGDYQKALDETCNQLVKKGYNVIKLFKKSPDAIATKNNKLYAIEIIGFSNNKLGNEKQKIVYNKSVIYEMFDGIMIRTFKYDDDSMSYFTEYFGGYNNKFHQKQTGLGYNFVR